VSRAYVNGRWCVRCNKTEPTPYLKQHHKKLLPAADTDFTNATVVDIGCGNCRNTWFMRGLGAAVVPLDMVAGKGCAGACVLGKEPLPCPDLSVDVVLANYVFMFLDDSERKQVVAEIKRICRPRAKVMVELYPALDSYAHTATELGLMQRQLFDMLGGSRILYSKFKFITEIP
jgi:SAM-dependent methyltransferase